LLHNGINKTAPLTYDTDSYSELFGNA